MRHSVHSAWGKVITNVVDLLEGTADPELEAGLPIVLEALYVHRTAALEAVDSLAEMDFDIEDDEEDEADE